MIKVEKYYKREAKELADMLFDKGFLNEDLTRDSVVWLEDYLGFLFQVKTESAVKCALLTKSLKERVATK